MPEILKNVPSIKKIVVVPYPGTEVEKIKNIKIETYNWNELIDLKNKNKIKYVMSNFNDPLAILYSSGTTGKPKCICHGTGGVLLQHNKELQIHSDVKENDRVFYFTTCGWMMWNWLVGALASGATILLFDGFPMYKKDDLLFEFASEEKATLFGVSAKYIDALNNKRIIPKNKHNLSKLRTICSTGSPLIKMDLNIFIIILKKMFTYHLFQAEQILCLVLFWEIYFNPFMQEKFKTRVWVWMLIFLMKRVLLYKIQKGNLFAKNLFLRCPLNFGMIMKIKNINQHILKNIRMFGITEILQK